MLAAGTWNKISSLKADAQCHKFVFGFSVNNMLNSSVSTLDMNKLFFDHQRGDINLVLNEK